MLLNKIIFTTLLLLFVSLNSIAQSCLPEGISFTSQAQVDNFKADYPNCTIIDGDLTINDKNINNLDSLSNITTINGKFYLNDNPPINLNGLKNLTSINGGMTIQDDGLVNFKGLENLKVINGDVKLDDNAGLYNLEGLKSLQEINGSLTISDNAIQNLDGIPALKTIKGSLIIEDNELENIEGLLSLIQVKGLLSIRDNNNLKSLVGLNNIDPTGILKLFVTESDSLSYCSVKSICTYIDQNIGPVTIDLNSTGCNTEAEISALCATTSTTEIVNHKQIKIYPNPSGSTINIEHEIPSVSKIVILDYTGRVVKNFISNQKSIDISNLQSGMYFIKLMTPKTVEQVQFVKR